MEFPDVRAEGSPSETFEGVRDDEDAARSALRTLERVNGPGTTVVTNSDDEATVDESDDDETDEESDEDESEVDESDDDESDDDESEDDELDPEAQDDDTDSERA